MCSEVFVFSYSKESGKFLNIFFCTKITLLFFQMHNFSLRELLSLAKQSLHISLFLLDSERT